MKHGSRALGDSGATAILGLIVSSLFFGLAFGTVLLATHGRVASSSDRDSTALGSVASLALDLLVRSAGTAAVGGAAWEKAPDAVKQIGLAAPGRSNFLDYNKVLALRGGALTASTNGYLDYPEAKSALSLPDVNFHLRTYPALPSVGDPHWEAMRGIRVGYIGHFNVDNHARPTITVNPYLHTTGLGYSLAEVTINYVSGPLANAFQVTYDLSTTSGHIVKNVYTPVLSPGTAFTTQAKYYDSAWPAGSRPYTMRVTVTDVATATEAYDNRALSIPLTSPGGNTYHLTVEPSKAYYWTGSKATLVLDKVKPDGSRYKTAPVNAYLTVTDPSGALVLDNQAITIPKASVLNYNVDMTNRPYGTYTVTLTSGGQTILNRFLWESAKLDTSTYTPSSDNVKERGYLGALVAGFANVTHYSGANPADVYRDHSDDLAPLGQKISDPVQNPYDILVVGSRITHSQLQGHFPQDALAFVQNGGTLIALGSDEGDVQWMKSIFGAGVATATGGISTPDATAPILHSPEELSYRAYDDHGRVYKIVGQDRDKFTHVIVKDASGANEKDTLALSNPGAYGKGTVIVTSYIPNEIFGSPSAAGDAEAKKLLHNLLAQAFNMLFIDYGPPIPSQVVVGSATRLALVSMPKVPGSDVELRVVLYTYR